MRWVFNLILAVVVMAVGHGGWALADPAGEIKVKGLKFVLAHRNPDHGLPLRPGGPSEAETTSWTVISLALTGADQEALDSALRFLDLTGEEGGIIRSIPQTAYRAMALAVSRGPTRQVQEACRQLLVAQRTEGGFSRLKGDGPAQTISTVAALEGMLAAGMSSLSPAVEDGLDWLHAAQNPDGGWPLEPGGPSLSLSTARVLRLFGRIKCFPEACGWGVSWLLKCRRPEGGFGLVPQAPADPELTALAALALRSLDGPEKVIAQALSNLASVQEADGGFVSHVPQAFNGQAHKNLRTTNLAVWAAVGR